MRAGFDSDNSILLPASVRRRGALAGLVLRQQAPHLCPPCYELREFFLMTDCSASSVQAQIGHQLASAARFHPAAAWPPAPRSHPCRRTSTSRHRSCASLTPTSRATSSAFRPASICLTAAIICASVCLLLDINPSPSLLPNRSQIWTNSRGQVSCGSAPFPILRDWSCTKNSRQRRLVREDLPLRTPRRGSGKSEPSQ